MNEKKKKNLLTKAQTTVLSFDTMVMVAVHSLCTQTMARGHVQCHHGQCRLVWRYFFFGWTPLHKNDSYK